MKLQEIMVQPIGNNIRNMRLKHKLTQRELAEKIGVTHSVIQRYECGVIAVPYKKLIALSEVFNVHVSYLLGFTNEQKPAFNDFELVQNRYNESQKYRNLILATLYLPDDSLQTVTRMLSAFNKE